MKKLKILVLNLIVLLSLNAQDKYDPDIIMKNNIKEIEGYIFEKNSKSDSFLITKEYFNSRGRRTKIEIYDTTGLKGEYIYIYNADTLKTERITKFHGSLNSKTKIHYDKKGREIKAVDYDRDGKNTGTYSKINYDDRNRIKETKIYFKNRLSIHQREKYDLKGSLVQYSIKKDGKWTQKLVNGTDPNFLKEEFENFDFTELKLIRKTLINTENTTIPGLKSQLKLAPKDILTTERYINPKGLLVVEKQYLNHNLIATKKYKYVLVG